MANMDYCKYRNTLEDLVQCFEADDGEEELSYEEEKARGQLIDTMVEYLENLGWDLTPPEEE